MPDHKLEKISKDPISHLDDEVSLALARHENLSGCFTIIGSVKICYSQVGSGFKVCLNLFGVDITCANVDLSNPCVKLEGSVILAKASVEVCIKGNCLTYEAKACYRTTPWSKWECTSASGKIICW
jgi:hypothetical protein